MFAVIGQVRLEPSEHSVYTFLYDWFGGICITAGFGLIAVIGTIAICLTIRDIDRL